MINVAKYFRRWGTVAIIAAVLLSSAGFIFQSVGAQGAQESITMSPSTKKYELEPGTVKSDTITILNDGDTAYDFTMYATPYWVKDANYQPDFAPSNPRADAFAWVSFDQAKYRAEPRETIVVPYTITVPEDAAPGGHYGTIFAEVQPPEGESNLARKKRVGSILYITTTGEVKLEGTTKSITIPWFQPTAPMQARATIENSGNSNFPATTKLTVSDIFGSVKAEVNGEYEILPGTTRDISLQWEYSPWFGLYNVKAATTVLGETTTASSLVLVMPFWMILLFIGVIIAGVVYALRRKKKQLDKKEQ